MPIRKFQTFSPQISSNVFVDETALVIGRVFLGEDASIWPMTVLRGDIHEIHVGARTNIQDGTIVHVTHDSQYNPGGHPVRIGNDVTVGHQVVLHGCQVDDLSLIGMGSLLLDGCHVPTQVIVGAGSLVPPGKQLESGYLYVGSPVRRVRALTSKEIEFLHYSAKHYVQLKNQHLK